MNNISGKRFFLLHSVLWILMLFMFYAGNWYGYYKEVEVAVDKHNSRVEEYGEDAYEGRVKISKDDILGKIIGKAVTPWDVGEIYYKNKDSRGVTIFLTFLILPLFLLLSAKRVSSLVKVDAKIRFAIGVILSAPLLLLWLRFFIGISDRNLNFAGSWILNCLFLNLLIVLALTVIDQEKMKKIPLLSSVIKTE